MWRRSAKSRIEKIIITIAKTDTFCFLSKTVCEIRVLCTLLLVLIYDCRLVCCVMEIGRVSVCPVIFECETNADKLLGPILMNEEVGGGGGVDWA